MDHTHSLQRERERGKRLGSDQSCLCLAIAEWQTFLLGGHHCSDIATLLSAENSPNTEKTSHSLSESNPLRWAYVFTCKYWTSCDLINFVTKGDCKSTHNNWHLRQTPCVWLSLCDLPHFTWTCPDFSMGSTVTLQLRCRSTERLDNLTHRHINSKTPNSYHCTILPFTSAKF